MKNYPKESWIDPRIKVNTSDIGGKGMFAMNEIKRSETVIIWGGALFTKADLLNGHIKEYSAARIGDDLYLGTKLNEEDSDDQYMNHSCDPNIWMNDEVTFVARRDIHRGEEITADYAMFGNNENWGKNSPCNCGSPLCRKHIHEDDWKLKELQDRYRNHFSPFINTWIKNVI